MLTTIAFALLLTPAAEPAARPEKPVLRFTGSKDGRLAFQLSNPSAESLPYVGYLSDSFEGGLAKGTIAPLYRIEVLRGKEWKAHNMGWCGTGLGKVSIPAKGKATFAVYRPDGDWDRVRVGVTCFKSAERKEPQVVWSDALSKEDLARKKP
jgi:hypothetical protein